MNPYNNNSFWDDIKGLMIFLLLYCGGGLLLIVWIVTLIIDLIKSYVL